MLGCLYVVQGLPFGFQATALPIYLREAGVSLSAIGWASALAAPWALKLLYAPLVDRFGSARWGRRRVWILPAQGGLALTCAAAAFVPAGEALGLLLALVFVMNLFAATQDVAVDGLAVDLLQPDELGPGNAAQVVGFKVGMLTGGGLLVWASASIGWTGLFLAMAAIVAAVWLMVLLVLREPPPRDASAPQLPLAEIGRRTLAAIRVPGSGWLLAIVATYKIGETAVDLMFKPFLIDQGFTAAQLGLWIGTWGMAFSLVGSLGGGWLARALTIRRALLLTACLRVAPMLGEWALTLSPPSAEAVIAVTAAEHLFGGALTTVLFALMMSRVDRRIGATHFTLLAAVEVLGKSPGAWVSGMVATSVGYGALFAAGAGVSIAFVLLVLASPSGPDGD